MPSKKNKKQVIDSESEEEEEKKQQMEEEGDEQNDDWESEEEENLQQQQKNKQKHEENVLYKLLNVEPSATSSEIKKSYRKLALEFHPDKNPAPEAKVKFQKITDAYNILKDEKKKKIYDQTGSYGDNFDEQNFDAAYEYYRTLYKKVEQKDIEEFEQKYRNSEEEKKDLIDFYNSKQGDIKLILETIMVSRNEDVDRFVKFYEEQIALKNIEKFSKFQTSKKKIRMLEDESDEANSALNDLVNQIQVRAQERGNDLLDMLAAKYAPQKKKKNNNNKNKNNEDQETKQKKKLKKK